MCDPLKLLRKYNAKRKEIVEKNDRFIFGNISLCKNTKTSFVIHGTKNKEHYTLKCLVYFLKYSSLKHIAYMRQAAIDKMPVVLKEDRRSILNYLFGQTSFCLSALDKNVAIAPPSSPSSSSPQKNSNPAKKPRLELESNKGFHLKDKQKISLRDVMPLERIAAIRAKYLARKQSLANNNEITKTYAIRVKNMNGRF